MPAEFVVEEVELPLVMDARWRPLAMTEDEWVGIHLRTISSTMPSLYMAAFIAGEIVGFVAFIGHMACLGDQVIPTYQAASVLTGPAYRGRGIFPAIVRAAEISLRKRGGGFIFGYPNAKAYPVWVGKLGYSTVRIEKWRAPALLGLSSLLIRTGGRVSTNAIRQNDLEMIEMKRRVYGDDVIVTEVDGALVWGVRRERSYGIKVSLFDIGGLRFETRPHLLKAYTAALHQAGQPSIVRFETVAENPDNFFFTGMITEKIAHRCMIISSLNLKILNGVAIGFFGGVRDTF